jgi:hypothetical protein
VAFTAITSAGSHEAIQLARIVSVAQRAVLRLVDRTVNGSTYLHVSFRHFSTQFSAGLSKAKIQTPTYDFLAQRTVVEFSIRRHPAGFVTEQRWHFETERLSLQCLWERVLSTELAVAADGSYACPKCNNTELDITPGRIRCLSVAQTSHVTMSYFMRIPSGS